MYRWSQWLFLTAARRPGLSIKGRGPSTGGDLQTTWHDPVETASAGADHNPVQLIQQTQWYLRISSYVPENDARLEELEQSGIWDESSLASQRFVLGRLDGVELDLCRSRWRRF